MSNEVVKHSENLTAAAIRENVNLIQEVMKAVMKNDVHYGTIPGTNKPTLYKAGAEKILSTFRIGVEPIVEDLSTQDEARFRVIARGFRLADGGLIGCGVGEASSNEEKYKWRKVSCDEEFEETIESRRREKWSKGKDGKSYKTKQVRTNIADVANTILKMAKKRAQIDLTLTATAASDVFAQDLEDLPEGLDIEDTPKREPVAAPKATSTGDKISEPQAKRFYAIAKGAGKTDDEIKQHLRDEYSIESTKDISKEIYNDVCKWAEAK